MKCRLIHYALGVILSMDLIFAISKKLLYINAIFPDYFVKRQCIMVYLLLQHQIILQNYAHSTFVHTIPLNLTTSEHPLTLMKVHLLVY